MSKHEEKSNRSDYVAVEAQYHEKSLKHIEKPRSAFQFFQRKMTPIIKQELQTQANTTGISLELGTISKEVSTRWHALSNDAKVEFIQEAEKDRTRYNKEMEERDLLVDAERKRKREELYALPEGKRERKRNPSFIQEENMRRSPRERKKVYTEAQLLAKQEKEVAKEIEKKEKKQRIVEQQRQKDVIAQKKSESAAARLQYLLGQSDLFAHFSGNINKKKKPEIKKKKSEVEEDAELLRDPHDIVRLTTQPSCIKYGVMRPYQLEGLSWMVNLAHQGINGVLADEMGLGKTVQTISVLGYMREFENITGPHIVLVPKSTLGNWLTEFSRWCPSIRAVKFHGNKEERARVIDEILCPGLSESKRKFDVCVTTFEMCLKAKTTLCKFAWRYLVIDEAHRIKNEASQFSTVVRTLETEHRLLLTGTPLQNNLHELWALLNFLLPDVFASSEEFDEWFNLDVDDDEAKQQMISQLHKILRPFMLRRLKADVEKTLPPKTETLLFVGMSPMQKALYKSLLLRDMQTIVNGTSGVSKSALQNIVMQLRKCCGHPYLFEGQEDRSLDPLGEHVVQNCGKMVLLDKLLAKLYARGSRVLIFTQMTRILDIMEDVFRMRHYQYCRIDGQTSYEDREAQIESFNAPNSKQFAFLLSTRAGGLGLNLYTADVVVLYDSDWNPQADLQAQDRAHRIGQKKEVNVYRLVTSDSVEEKIIERAQQKLKLDAMVVQQGRLQEKATKLSKNDMIEMIRFGADQVFRAGDAAVTDEDIDAILAQGKQRTEDMKAKLQTHDKGDLLDFKLDGGSSIQTHDGVDYSNEKERQEEFRRLAEAELQRHESAYMGKRERRAVLRQSQIALNQASGVDFRLQKNIPKCFRLPRMDDWRFYNRTRLIELHNIEMENYKLAMENLGTDKPPLPPMAQYLTPEQLEEKQQLLDSAFGDWNKPQFYLFIKLLSRFGRQNLASVAKEMGKPQAEVERYTSVFLARGPNELSDFPKILKNIEKCESKLLDIERLLEETRKKIQRVERDGLDPYEDMTLNYQGKAGKAYTEEEDRVLLCLVNYYGFGAWEKIKYELSNHDLFAFDYYLRSRTTAEIARRCDTLMRICEKDNAESELREKKDQEHEMSLITQRQELDSKLEAAKKALKSSQDRVDALIMKEAKRMQAQQKAKRAKKRKERDAHEVLVEKYSDQLCQYLETSTDRDAAKIAISFCDLINSANASMDDDKTPELQASYVLKKIRQVAEPIENALKGDYAWRVLADYKRQNQLDPTEYRSVKKKKTMMKTDEQGKGESTQQLPRSPWSPSAMKNQKDTKPVVNRRPFSKSSNGSNVYSVRKPRSAYVLFSINQRRQVRESIPGAPISEVMAKVSELWKQMNDEERVPWMEEARLDQERYDRELREQTTQ